MSFLRLTFALALIGILGTACSHLDISAAPLGDQVLHGTVDFHPLPPLGKTSVLVRMVDVTNDDPIVIGETTVQAAGAPPVPFTISYKASDIEPPKRVQLVVRVSVDGKLRYYNIDSYAVSPMNADRTVRVWVTPVRR
ncbi:hypothetical protein GALL_10420 [mine drainage metagenome]|uniref:Lipoprotein n=1 Tax=mine drainage metagenome TaxID=410659 RepID=A0A1J5U314_9ZZZZ